MVLNDKQANLCTAQCFTQFLQDFWPTKFWVLNLQVYIHFELEAIQEWWWDGSNVCANVVIWKSTQVYLLWRWFYRPVTLTLEDLWVYWWDPNGDYITMYMYMYTYHCDIQHALVVHEQGYAGEYKNIELTLIHWSSSGCISRRKEPDLLSLPSYPRHFNTCWTALVDSTSGKMWQHMAQCLGLTFRHSILPCNNTIPLWPTTFHSVHRAHGKIIGRA